MNCQVILSRKSHPRLRPRRRQRRKGIAGDLSGNLQLKNKVQATGSTSNPTTRSSTYAVVPELTTTITTKGNKVLVTASCWILPDTANSIAAGYFAFFRDGSQISQDFFQNMWGTSAGTGFIDERTVTITYIDSPSAASHTYDLRWKNSIAGAPGVEAFGTSRQLQVTELG